VISWPVGRVNFAFHFMLTHIRVIENISQFLSYLKSEIFLMYLENDEFEITATCLPNENYDPHIFIICFHKGKILLYIVYQLSSSSLRELRHVACLLSYYLH